MANFKERLKEREISLISKGSFKEKMEAIGDSVLRKWVIMDLAEMTDTSMWSVAHSWTNGVIPPICKQRIIANYFGCDFKELFPEVK